MKVSIVIPNWNGRALLEKNLPSVVAAKKNSQNRIQEIIVVDDKSTDDSVDFLEKSYSQEIKLVRHTKNRGFPNAVNTGARTAKGKLICLLNTDVRPEKDFLKAALPHFRDKNVFAVSFHEAGFGFAQGKFEKGFIVHQPQTSSETSETFWASGGSSVFRRDLWMKLKGMDETTFMPFYWEDLDLSYRAQKRGYKLLWEPQARVIHEHESTINVTHFKKGFLNRIKERNQLLLIWKNLTSQNLIRKHLVGLIKRIARHPGYLRVVFSALKKISVVIRKRRIEKKESKVSDETIFAKFG